MTKFAEILIDTILNLLLHEYISISVWKGQEKGWECISRQREQVYFGAIAAQNMRETGAPVLNYYYVIILTCLNIDCFL